LYIIYNVDEFVRNLSQIFYINISVVLSSGMTSLSEFFYNEPVKYSILSFITIFILKNLYF